MCRCTVYLLMVTCLAAACGTAAAGPAPHFDNTPVCTEPGRQYRPAISGDYVVWLDGFYERQVVARNLRTGEQFALTQPDQYASEPPAIDGNLVVFMSNTGMCGYDLLSRRQFPIEVGEVGIGREHLDIGGTIVTWQSWHDGEWGHNYDVWAHDLLTGRTFPVAVDEYQAQAPSIGDGLIVWGERRDHDYLIRGYEVATGETFTVADGPGMRGFPVVSGSTVAWSGNTDWGTNLDIYARNLNTEEVLPVCTAWNLQWDPAIDGSLVVWSDARNGGHDNMDVYGFDLATGTELAIATAPGYQGLPAVSGSIVVWEDRRTDDWTLTASETELNIFLAAVPEPATLAMLLSGSLVLIRRRR